MEDSVSKHYLSEVSLSITPAFIIEQDMNMKSLRNAFETEAQFIENICEQGLGGEYLKMILSKKSRQ